MKEKLEDLGPASRPSMVGDMTRKVNVTRTVLSQGLNLMSTDLTSVMPNFGSIVETAMDPDVGIRVICFHDDPRIYGISSHNGFDILQIGGKIGKKQIIESDAEHIAQFAIDNSKVSIFINLAHLREGKPARFIGSFLGTYADNLDMPGDYEIFANYGIQRQFTRKRDHMADTRATHEAMRFQALASTRNMGILNVTNSLSELPREFVLNTPNLGIGRITMVKHLKELGSHLCEKRLREIKQFEMKKHYGAMLVEDGYITYFNGSDLPSMVGDGPPYMLEPEELLSNIGKDWDGTDPENNKHLIDFERYLKTKRREAKKKAQKKAARENAAQARKMVERAVQKKAAESAIRLEASREMRSSEMTILPPAKKRFTGITTANDNHNKTKKDACGSKRFSQRSEAVELLKAANIASSGLLVSSAIRVLSATPSKFAGQLPHGLDARKVAMRIAEDELLREAIHGGNSFAVRHSKGNDVTISGPACAAAYYRMLREDAAKARTFLVEMMGVGHNTELCTEGALLVQTLKNLGRQRDHKTRSEAQYQTLLSAWIGYCRQQTYASPKAA